MALVFSSMEEKQRAPATIASGIPKGMSGGCVRICAYIHWPIPLRPHAPIRPSFPSPLPTTTRHPHLRRPLGLQQRHRGNRRGRRTRPRVPVHLPPPPHRQHRSHRQHECELCRLRLGLRPGCWGGGWGGGGEGCLNESAYKREEGGEGCLDERVCVSTYSLSHLLSTGGGNHCGDKRVCEQLKMVSEMGSRRREERRGVDE